MSFNNTMPGWWVEMQLEKGLREMPFTVAANPSTNRVRKPHHYNFLRVMWKLELVSLDGVRKCADALQEGPASFP